MFMQQEDFSKYNGEGTPLRKAQCRMLEMLKEVDAICRRNHIDYWIDAGTLLGAVRHGGFIPWDDDVDVCVLRKDYPRAREVLMKELPDAYKFVDWTTDSNYFDACGRVKSVNSHVDIPDYRYQKEQGVYIDVFPMEELASMRDKYVGELLFGKIFRHYHNSGKAVTKSPVRRWITKVYSTVCYPLVYGIISLMRKHGAKRPNRITYGFALCTVYPEYEPQWIFPTKDIVFEGVTVRAPHDEHKYLTTFYGNYMQIPPENKRITHSHNWEIW